MSVKGMKLYHFFMILAFIHVTDFTSVVMGHAMFSDVIRLCKRTTICLAISSCAPLIALSSIEYPVEKKKPTDADIRIVQMAFKDFDLKRLDASEKEFSISINKWKSLNRPRDEIVSLLKARAGVFLDSKQFQKAIEDDNESLELMKTDGEKEDGTANYPEYPDAYVERALAKEGLADWQGALEDYNKAISLWGGAQSESFKPGAMTYVNPYVLTYRGNTLCRLGRYKDAIQDYEAASDFFNAARDVARYSDARANSALATYEAGDREAALKIMRDVIRKNPGSVDMHVAVATDSWSQGDYISALKEWRFACDEIDVGCKSYEDMNWVQNIRRWPPSMVENLKSFLERRIPDSIKGSPGQALAPSPYLSDTDTIQ